MIYFFHHYELPAIEQQDRIQQMLVRTQHQQQRQQMQQRQQQQQQLRQQQQAATAAANHVSGNPTPTVVTNSDGLVPPTAATPTVAPGDDNISINNSMDDVMAPDEIAGSSEIPSMGDIVTPDEIAEQLSSLANELQEDESTYSSISDTNLPADVYGDTDLSTNASNVPVETIGTQLYPDPGGSNVDSSPNETLSSVDIDANNGADSVDNSVSSENGPRDILRDEACSDTADMVLRCRTASQPKSNSTSPVEDGGDGLSSNDTRDKS